MKIFIVCNNLGCGGAERVGVNLANGFTGHHHQVFIITDIHQKANYPVDKKVIILPFCEKKEGKISKWRKAIQNIRKYTRQEKPDVIIGIMEVCTLTSFIATLGMKIPLIMTEHNSFERPASAPLSLKDKVFKFWINKLYKNITVLTVADKLYIGKQLKNVTVMPNPLFLSPTTVIPTKDKIVLAAGRIDDWHCKGFDTLLQAWSKIHDSRFMIHDWWLKIAGEGKKESFEYLMNLLPDGNWIHNEDDNENENWFWRSEKYHIDFLGYQKDMESLYKKSEIFVLSSRYEGFGLVLIEAMSQGCAPIACDYKGRQREILYPESVSSFNSQNSNKEICENGILCEPDNVDGLTNAIQKMISDEDYRKNVQQNAVNRSKFYNLENIIPMWEKLIKKISVS